VSVASGEGALRELVLATHNAHKLREFERILRAAGGGVAAGGVEGVAAGGVAGTTGAANAVVAVELVALPREIELPPELGETFAENALAKARAAARACGRVSVADDSGIAAEALGGAPGVRSARYAGAHASDEENLSKLIREAPAGSRLEYVCVIAYVEPEDGGERTFEGRCAGRMAAEPRGTGGFGYDPVFEPDDGPPGRTMAELGDAEKDAISHRGRAARALLAWLSDVGS
jgi:XTP/dITP diphosphohydrolase